MRSQHPAVLGRSNTPLQGVWVRHKGTGAEGYITHVERSQDPEQPAVLWIMYPPNGLVKTWSAGSASVEEVKRLKRPPQDL